MTWGLGLLIANLLARTSTYFAPRRGILFSLSDMVLSYYSFDPIVLGFSLIEALSLGIILRGVWLLLEARESREAGLESEEVRTLLPLYRVRTRRRTMKVLAVEETRIALYTLSMAKHAEGFLLDEDLTSFGEGIAFEFPGPDSTRRNSLEVVIDQVGLVGPWRWRRIRLSQNRKSRTFWVSSDEYPNLRNALKLVAGPAVVERANPRRSWADWSFLILSIAFALLNAALALLPERYADIDPVVANLLGKKHEPVDPVVANLLSAARTVAWSGPIAVVFGYLAWGRKGIRWGRASNRRLSLPAKEKKPWNSVPLGWLLKLASVAYAAFILTSPHVDLWIEQRTRDSVTSYNTFLTWLLIPAALLMFVGYRLTRRTIMPGVHADARPPFLFLRAFDDDDRKTLQPVTWLGWFLGVRPGFAEKGKRLSAIEMAYIFNPVRWLRMLVGNPIDTVEEALALGIRKRRPARGDRTATRADDHFGRGPDVCVG